MRHKTTNWKLSCTVMTTESGVDVLKKLVTDYTVWDQQGTEIWNWSQTHPAYSYQQALPFIISLLLLHARNTTLSLSFWNISKFCLSAVENKASLPSLAKPMPRSDHDLHKPSAHLHNQYLCVFSHTQLITLWMCIIWQLVCNSVQDIISPLYNNMNAFRI